MGAHTYPYGDPVTVDGETFHVTVTHWTNDSGLSFDVYWNDELLTEAESLDNPPTDDELRNLLENHKANR